MVKMCIRGVKFKRAKCGINVIRSDVLWESKVCIHQFGVLVHADTNQYV